MIFLVTIRCVALLSSSSCHFLHLQLQACRSFEKQFAFQCLFSDTFACFLLRKQWDWKRKYFFFEQVPAVASIFYLTCEFYLFVFCTFALKKKFFSTKKFLEKNYSTCACSQQRHKFVKFYWIMHEYIIRFFFSSGSFTYDVWHLIRLAILWRQWAGKGDLRLAAL